MTAFVSPTIVRGVSATLSADQQHTQLQPPRIEGSRDGEGEGAAGDEAAWVVIAPPAGAGEKQKLSPAAAMEFKLREWV